MNLFHSIRQSYGSFRIRTKLFLMILLAVSVPMLFLMAILLRFGLQLITSDTIRAEQTAASVTAPVLDNYLASVVRTSTALRQTDYLQTLLGTALEDELEEVVSSESAAAFEEEYQQILADSPVTNIRLYLPLEQNAPVFSAAGSDSIYAPISRISATYWYGIFSASRPSTLFCPSFYLGRKEQELGDLAYIRPVYIRQKSGITLRCFLAAYFPSEDLKAILAENLPGVGSLSYITNERDAVAASTDPAQLGIYYMDYESIQENLMSSNGFLEKQVLGENIYVGYYYLAAADWVLVSIVPSAPLQQRANSLFYGFLFLWALAAILGVLLSMWLSHSLTRRIQAVSEQMSLVKNAPPVPIDSPSEQDEVGELIDSYNYMARQINNLMQKQQEDAEEIRIAEFNALQAQINPHFLYNTMEMIGWMAQQGRTRETNQAIRDLSRFYRLTLSRKNSINSLEEEIEHVTIYVRLQNMRFEDSIDFVVDVPDSLLEYRIPKLTLQPIVENAIVHGILEKESHRGAIVLTGWLEENDIVLLVSDDGVGISKEKLAGILKKKHAQGGKGNHIAIYNTHRRLQVLYGTGYGLTYRSQEGKGTDVEIRFPAILSDDELSLTRQENGNPA